MPYLLKENHSHLYIKGKAVPPLSYKEKKREQRERCAAHRGSCVRQTRARAPLRCARGVGARGGSGGARQQRGLARAAWRCRRLVNTPDSISICVEYVYLDIEWRRVYINKPCALFIKYKFKVGKAMGALTRHTTACTRVSLPLRAANSAVCFPLSNFKVIARAHCYPYFEYRRRCMAFLCNFEYKQENREGTLLSPLTWIL